MKIYALTNSTGTMFVSGILETEKFYLVPIKDSFAVDAYAKDVFKLQVIEAHEPHSPEMGFKNHGG